MKTNKPPRGNNWTAQQQPPPPPPSLEQRAEARVREICGALGCSLDDIKTASREQFYVFARYIVVAQLTDDGFPYSISAQVVARERTMVRHGLDTFDDLVASRHAVFLSMLEKWTEARDAPGVHEETGGTTPGE